MNRVATGVGWLVIGAIAIGVAQLGYIAVTNRVENYRYRKRCAV